MDTTYWYCPPGGYPRQIRVCGYSIRGNNRRFLARDTDDQGRVIYGPHSREEWVEPWFKEGSAAPIDWNRYTRLKLELNVTARAEG